MKKVALLVLLASVALPVCAAPYVAVRGTVNRVAGDVNQWQYAPSMANPTQGEISIIADGTEYKNVGGLQVAVGTSVTDNIRAEIEYGYTGTVKRGGQFDYHINSFTLPTNYQLKSTIQTLGINVYYDFHNNTKFTPYVGTGIGYAGIREKGRVENTYATVEANDYYYRFTWNINAGVGYALTERLTADFGIRYSILGNKETTQYNSADNYKSAASRNYESWQAALGLRYSF